MAFKPVSVMPKTSSFPIEALIRSLINYHTSGIMMLELLRLLLLLNMHKVRIKKKDHENKEMVSKMGLYWQAYCIWTQNK